MLQLVKKELKPKLIHGELVRSFGAIALTYKAVEYHRRKYLQRKRGVPEIKLGRHRHDYVDERILTLRAAGTRVSTRKTAKLIKVPRSTTLDHFHQVFADHGRVKQAHILKKLKRSINHMNSLSY